jgi:hypothetical protein
MTFDSDGICILESLTTVDECEAYKDFLKLELARHRRALNYAQAVMRDKLAVASRHVAEAQFWESAVSRHEDDMRASRVRLLEIEAHKAKLEGACST